MERTYKKGKKHEFRHYLFDPLLKLSNSYLVQQNLTMSTEFLKKALQCLPDEFTDNLYWLRGQIQLALNYVCLGRLADAKNCVQNAMTACRQLMGVEQKLFQKLFPLFPKARAILYTVFILI